MRSIERVPSRGRVVGGGRFDWRTELLVAALAAAETAALWLVVALFVARDGSGAGAARPLALFALVYGAVLTPRLLEAFDVWDPAFEVWMGLAVAVTTLTAVKVAAFPELGWLDGGWVRGTARDLVLRPSGAVVPVWGVVAVAAYAWWRGRRRAEPSLDAAYRSLRVGTVAVFAGAALHGLAGSSEGERGTSGAVLVFFVASLGAIALARLRLQTGHDAVALGPRWLPTFLLPIVATVAVAVVAAGIFSRDLLDTVLWALAPLVWALSVVVRVFIIVVAVIAFILVSPLLWFLSRRTLRLTPLEGTPAVGGSVERLQRDLRQAADVPDAIRYLIALAVLMVVFSAITRFALRRRRRSPLPSTEERESVLDPRDLLGALGSRLRALLGRRRRAPDGLTGLRGDPRWVATVEIRETYRRLLAWSRDQGAPRPPSSTPWQHADHLTPRLVDRAARTDIATITERYNEARYGDAPATAAEAATVRAAWNRLRRTSRLTGTSPPD